MAKSFTRPPTTFESPDGSLVRGQLDEPPGTASGHGKVRNRDTGFRPVGDIEVGLSTLRDYGATRPL